MQDREDCLKNLQDVQLVTISCTVMREPSKGHPYWFHRTLGITAKKIGVSYSTIGPFDQQSTEIAGLLSHSGEFRPASSVFAFLGMRSDFSKINDLLIPGGKYVVQIYEGGFREFVLALFLMHSRPDLKICFNFNLTDPWEKIFLDKRVSARIARGLVTKYLSKFSANLIPFAETYETADAFSTALGVKFRQYPLFSTLQALDGLTTSSKTRNFDVAFFPLLKMNSTLSLMQFGI